MGMYERNNLFFTNKNLRGRKKKKEIIGRESESCKLSYGQQEA